jgi:hypothetical protein
MADIELWWSPISFIVWRPSDLPEGGYSTRSSREKTIVLFKYPEILFGILIGLGVFVVDTFMDATNEALSFTAELSSHPSMVYYRLLFVIAGFILGWLLWQRNSRTRDFRRLQESMDQLRRECGRRSVLLHASLQVLLTRTDFGLPAEAEQLVRRAYESSQEIQALVR